MLPLTFDEAESLKTEWAQVKEVLFFKCAGCAESLGRGWRDDDPQLYCLGPILVTLSQ
ncbi:MAG: hypothetical protein JWQ97_3451 [Phenylobacterium sp.]|nr:hypothetical protein [Phenylobacterium sp.]